MAERIRRFQDDHCAARSPDPSLRYRRDRQRQLALQEPRRRPHSPRSRRLRNPGQLRRRERYRQISALKGVKIGRRYGVNIGSRLTVVLALAGSWWSGLLTDGSIGNILGFRDRTTAIEAKPAVAVLPLLNQSNDPAREYFA